MQVKNTYFFLVFLMFLSFISCHDSKKEKLTLFSTHKTTATSEEIYTGAQQTALYVPLLKNKKVAIVANQTSVIFKNQQQYTHLVDSLIKRKVTIVKVFSPEHGFRGKADASEKVADGIDVKTGLSIVSLYGKNKKPTPAQLQGIDVVVFDIQDVGVRFYTYISTLHYVLEACTENNIPVIVLDRPNPNGHYVDGPTLQPKYKTFVGMHPVPLVYGMTIGEYAKMIVGEKWIANSEKSKLTIIPLKNYTHQSTYNLPIRPSPNLPNRKAINLYPSLGFFEGTTINAGRGTEMQFQVYGAPFFPKSDFTYTPKANFGAKYPKHKGTLCYGVDLRNTQPLYAVTAAYLIDAYKKTPKTQSFFGKTFTAHAGNTDLETQIKNGISAKQIHQSWQPEVEKFKKIRAKYLLYE